MTRQTHRMTSTARLPVRGFTLIEVLVALIVMSVGMLGIAGLYVHGLKAGRTSTFAHGAVVLAGDVADRIRANPTAGAVYEGGGANNSCVDGGVNCTPAQMAAHDILLWTTQATDTLPNGAIDVDYTAGVGLDPATYEITVSWTEPGENLSYQILIPVREI
ncbi:MAG: type IV pilus modification protein PilV [Woeseia sp.]|nr:type IV pilus modification protein PilV [Woeseia sp.]MBT8097107.1 type IV pilus modification protein PilV [Woeseia sp.]NNE59821.1 type IV pilus modification protein PilV [Woeseia sp.]